MPSRRPRRLRTLAVAAALALAAGAVAPAAASAAQVAGVQGHLLWPELPMSEMDVQLDSAKAAGAGLMRVDLGWDTLEQDGEGRYSQWYLDRVDALVEKAQARGIKLLVTFWRTPCWASSAPADLKQDCAGEWWDRGVERYAPTDASDYAQALEFLTARYRGRVAAWEIWNEPNSQTYLRTADAPGDYARLVRAAYPAAKRGDAGTTIVAGSTVDADFEFVDALYRRGVEDHFDALSIHPYSGDVSPLDPRPNWTRYSFVAGVPAVRETMLRHGDTRPMWLTELGWSSATVRGGAPYENGVDESFQATYLQQAYEQMRAWDYVAVGVWFNLKDTGGDRSVLLDNYGLTRHDGSPKPAYEAFRASAAALASGAPDRTAVVAAHRPAARKATPRLKIRARRHGRRVRVRGTGPAGRTVTLRFFARGRRGFARGAAYRLRVRTDRRGRFTRRIAIPRRRAKVAWRISARSGRQKAVAVVR